MGCPAQRASVGPETRSPALPWSALWERDALPREARETVTTQPPGNKRSEGAGGGAREGQARLPPWSERQGLHAEAHTCRTATTGRGGRILCFEESRAQSSQGTWPGTPSSQTGLAGPQAHASLHLLLSEPGRGGEGVRLT